MPDEENVTELLVEWSGGKRDALDRLMPLIYRELRRLAALYLGRERPGHTLQPTALVNEAYLRLVDQRRVEWKSRSHFFGISAQMMRRILIDHARANQSDKRGGDRLRVTLDSSVDVAGEGRDIDLIALDAALDELARVDPRQARLVELRFFVGLTLEETAEILEVAPITVRREWNLAKAWLFRRLRDSHSA
jgi:RNA polymerase sigma factor (TIGR02999 family)